MIKYRPRRIQNHPITYRIGNKQIRYDVSLRMWLGQVTDQDPVVGNRFWSRKEQAFEWLNKPMQ